MTSTRDWKWLILLAGLVLSGCGQSGEKKTASAPELRAREPRVAVAPSSAPKSSGAQPESPPATDQPQTSAPSTELSPPTSGQTAPEGRVPQEGQPAQGASPQPSAQAADPFQVPDGPPEKIFAFLESLQNVQPSATDEASIDAFRKKLATAVLTAADKILAQSQVATEDQLTAAIQLKILALRMLGELGDSAAARTLASLPADLEAAGKPELARKVRFATIMEELQRSGEMTDAEVAQLAEKVQKYIQVGPVDKSDATLVVVLCQVLESRQLNELLIGLHKALAQQLATSQDQDLQQLGKLVEGIARRAGLVGQPMEVSGVTLNGQPLDWESYKGKVVLVTFWATWCGPCRREIPALLQAYESYHQQGFDIVAISVDDDRKALETFLQENKLPWTILFDQESPGEKMASKYGVMSIPQMILVGRDGKVVATGVRGHSLPEYLNQLIGPPASTNQDPQLPPPVPEAMPATAPQLN